MEFVEIEEMEDSMRMSPSQLAKMFGINKKTLLYYDEIDLFKPSIRDENGYRYYTYDQLMSLEMILYLRRVGVPIQKLQTLIKNRSALGLCHALREEQTLLANKIEELQSISNFISDLCSFLEGAHDSYIDEIKLKCLPRETLIGTPLTSAGSMQIKETQAFYDNIWSESGAYFRKYMFGSILPKERLLSGQYTAYSHVTAFVTENRDPSILISKQGGWYLVLYWKGPWDTLPQAYTLLRAYADEHGLTISGDAYEKNILDKFAESSDENYLTRIEVSVDYSPS